MNSKLQAGDWVLMFSPLRCKMFQISRVEGNKAISRAWDMNTKIWDRSGRVYEFGKKPPMFQTFHKVDPPKIGDEIDDWGHVLFEGDE